MRGCMVGLMARCHDPVQVDEGYGGANFIFKGYFSTMGMSVLWPLRVLQRRSTGRWYANLVTDKPEAVRAAWLPPPTAPAPAPAPSPAHPSPLCPPPG